MQPLSGLHELCSDTNEIMGFLGMDHSNVDALFLAPEFLRRGGGRCLIRHAQRLRGELTVDVNEQNADARTFYGAESCAAAAASGSPRGRLQ
jgi:putative acetyltransferase